MRRFITDPAATAQAIIRASAADEVAAAKACITAAPAPAVVHAARARDLDPTDLDAQSLLEKLTTLHGFQLNVTSDARIAAARAELEQKPDDPALLRKLANLYRGAQNPLESARVLKRYVALKPDDAMARKQLEELVGADDVAAFTSTFTRKGPNQLKTGEIVQGVKTGGFGGRPVAAAVPREAPVDTTRTPTRPSGSVAFGGPVLVAADGPRDTMSTTTKLALGVIVVGVIGEAVSMGRSLIASGNTHVEKNLKAVEDLGAPLVNLVDGTQAPFLERAHQAARIADWQGALDAANFGLSADPDLGSRTSPKLLLVRARARAQLGDTAQAIIDARLARGLAAAGSAERTEAEQQLQQLEQAAPPPPAPSQLIPASAGGSMTP
jgi:hypothetical protein